jgi:antitoxin component HigA of HigAB toxin-antitoxin module
MEISTEAHYQQVLRRLEYLLDHEPTNVDEITTLGNVVNKYENDNGHRPLPPNSLIARLERERLERQLSDQQLADLLGISQKKLRAVPIDLDLAKRLHRQLGIPGDFILEAA